MHDPHQAGGGLRGEDDAAVIELYRSKHDQAAEQTQRLVEPETHVPTPFLPAGKRIVTQTRGKGKPSHAIFRPHTTPKYTNQEAAASAALLFINGIAQNNAASCCQTGSPTSQRMTGTNSSAGR